MPAPEPSFATVLQAQGLAGYVITLLVSAIGALGLVIGVLYRNQVKVSRERIAERDVLRDGLNNAVRAIDSMVKISDERNDITNELAEKISQWSISNELIKERLHLQHESNTEKLRDITIVVGSTAEALRTLVGVVTDLRNIVFSKIPQGQAMPVAQIEPPPSPPRPPRFRRRP